MCDFFDKNVNKVSYQKFKQKEKKRLTLSEQKRLKSIKFLNIQRLNIVLFFIKLRKLLQRNQKMPSSEQITPASSFDVDSETSVWPEDVRLYQPYEVEQILLPDNAHCLAVQTYLKMMGLKYTVEYRSNAEYMSPSGRVPFIKAGVFLVAELDPIVKFTQNKGFSLSNELDEPAKSDMRAFMSLVNTVLGNAENYLTWIDPTTYKEVTKPRHGAVSPWPLNLFLTYKKKLQVQHRLKTLQWMSKSIDQVYKDVDQCCKSLSERLEKNKYFFKDEPTELDALVFGHLYAVLTTPLPNNRFASIIRDYPNLVDLCTRIERTYYKKDT